MVKNLDDIGKSITSNIRGNIIVLLNVKELNFENLYFPMRDLSNSEKEKVIIIIINRLIEKAKPDLLINKYHRIAPYVDKTISYYNIKEDVGKEENRIANSLLFKAIFDQFDLPIDMNYIKNNFLSINKVNKEHLMICFMDSGMICCNNKMNFDRQ